MLLCSEDCYMFPTIFISSTFYDLKYAREDLAHFIEGYGFCPIRSENGDIGYTPGWELDASCYEAMSHCDMAILIVGGRYGSPASSETVSSDDRFEKYLSVTHKEFDAAIKANLPVFVFIEESVYNEYRLYKNNKDTFENKEANVNFVAVDHINVHRFIDDIHTFPKTSLPIKSFNQVSDIKDHLKKQWADMFQKHLIGLRKGSYETNIMPSIQEIYASIQKMNIWLKKVGEQVVGTNSDELRQIEFDQKVEVVSNNIANTFEFFSRSNDIDFVNKYLLFFVSRLVEAKNNGYLEYPFSEDNDQVERFESLFKYEGVLITRIDEQLSYVLEDLRDDEDLKIAIVQRLMQHDYLSKMKFVK